MGCFIAPATEAIVTTVAQKVVENKYKNCSEANKKVELEQISTDLKRLEYLLWGGSGLLAFEHLWHGEVAPFFPFLTAVSNPEELTAMLYEIGTVGVSMAVLVTAIWGVSTYVLRSIQKSNKKFTKKEQI